MYQFIDFLTKQTVVPHNFVFTGENNPWEVMMDLSEVRSKINQEYFKMMPPNLSKYLPLMPIKKIDEFVSLREMATPLVKSKFIGKQLGLELYFKLESKNPTGSFKDRGSAVEVSVAKELGAKAIILASTGNMAASCACYAAAAKIPCFVLVPEGVPITKLAQVIAFGGHIVQVKGTYNDAAELAKNIAVKKGFYLAGDYAFRVEGQKSAAFEMLDQLWFDVPDWVIVPIGCGTNLAAYAKGFDEYYHLGFIHKKPKLMGVQAAGAAAVVQSFQQSLTSVQALSRADTVASAIAVTDPVDGSKALNAIYDSNGMAVSVSDKEIMDAQYLLSIQEGFFVETSSAATVAALLKAPPSTHQKVICVLTGDGMKEAGLILKSAKKLPVYSPADMESLGALYA